MPVLPRPSGPLAVWRDIRAFLKGDNRHRLLFGALALVLPGLMIAGFAHDAAMDQPKPQMWFVPSWPADRPDAVIVAEQKIDQAARDKAAAEKRAAYQRLARRLGID